MSLVVFPVDQEDLAVVGANLRIAAVHERIHEVWAVTAADQASLDTIAVVADEIEETTSTPIHVFPQERLGRYRPGKGDAMNTAIRHAAGRGFDRTHFYDADITNFDRSWIDGAELAADRGFEVVRHRFPRAATDAMVTWMITRPGLAKLFPGTFLPRLGQPLGGEVLLSSEVIAALASDELVVGRSDWGIDTVITYASAVGGHGVYEHYAPDGKRHALYGSLVEIRDMVIECLDAVASLNGRPSPPPESSFESDDDHDVPADLKQTVAYDLEATRREVSDRPDHDELAVLDRLGYSEGGLDDIDEDRWGDTIDRLIDDFRLGDPSWERALFRLWVHRVLHYTAHHVPLGYDHAIGYLEETIRGYERGG